MSRGEQTLPLPPQDKMLHEGDAGVGEIRMAAAGLIAFYEARNAADRASGRPPGFTEQVSSIGQILAGPLNWRHRARWAANLTASLVHLDLQGGHPGWTPQYIAAVRPLVVALLAEGGA